MAQEQEGGAVSPAIKDKMVRYAELKALKESWEEKAKENDEEMKQLLIDIKEGMEVSETDLVRLPGIGRFQLERKTFISVLAADKPKALEWLKDHSKGSDLIYETYKDAEFNKLIDEIIDNNEPAPDFVKIAPTTICKLVRVASK